MTIDNSRRHLRLLFPFLLCVLAARSAVSEPWPHEHSDIPPDPRIEWGRLENGLRYAVRANHEPAGRVYLILHVHAGSLEERDDQLGYAHFVEHMLFNGTRLYPGATLVEELQREGLEFGADTSAFTTYDSTFFNLDLPQNSEERIGHGLQVLREFADGATIDKAGLKKEMGVIESERRTRETTVTPAAEELDHFLYPDSRLARRLPIGTTKSVEGATAPGLLEFYRTWYRPSRMTVIAVGDADPALLARLIREKFSSLQPAVDAEPVEPDAGPFGASDGTHAHFISVPGEAGTTSLIDCINPPRAGGDTVANRRLQVQEAAGFWILNERFQDVVRANPVELGQAQASWQDYRHSVRLSTVRVDSRAHVWRRGLRTAEQELRRALIHGFTANEVSEQIARFRHFYTEAIRTESTLSSPALAHTIRTCLESDMVCSSAETNWDLLADTVGHLQPDGCSEQFRAAWATGNRRVAVIGPRSVPVSDQGVLTAFEESQAGLLTAQDDVASAKFDYTSFGRPGEILQRNHVGSIDAETLEFANHVRLNIKRTDFEAGRVYLRARVGGGLLSQPEYLPGLGMMASGLLIEGGLGRHDDNELKRIMAGTTISLEFSVEEEACYFSGMASSDSVEMLLQLFTAYLTDPAYRFGAYQRAVGQLQSFYSETSRDPVAYLHALAPRLLADGNNRYGVPPIEQTLSRSPQQVQQWLQPQLTRGELEIGLVGDLDPEQVVAAATRTVGTLGKREPNPPPDSRKRAAFPSKPVKRVFKIQTSESKAIVQVGWPGTDDSDFHRDRRISVLGEILNDRLRVKLREELGITYAPSGDSWASKVWPGYGYLFVEVIVAPRQAEKAADLIMRIADDIRAHGITPDEFNRARQPRLAMLTQELRKNSYWLYHVLPRLQSAPAVVEMPLSRRGDYEAMRAGDINEVARECFGTRRSCVLIVQPK